MRLIADIRLEALKLALATFGDMTPSPRTILELAAIFEAYISKGTKPNDLP